MSIRARFICKSVEKFHSSEVVRLKASTTSETEDREFAVFTPPDTGLLSIDITRPSLLGRFTPGEEYWLYISPVVENGISQENDTADESEF